jgi:dihydrofolate reductase
MKRVIFQMSVSVDGYIEGPNHEIDWHLVDDEFNAYAVEMLKASAALIMGRLIDELRIVHTPILLGGGKTVFDGIKKRYPLRLLSTKEFKSGNVVSIYEPALRRLCLR